MIGNWFRKNSAGIGTFMRVAFGFVWLVDGLLKLQPGTADAFVQTMQGMVASQPTWLTPWFSFWSGMITQNPNMFVSMIVTCEILLGLTLIFGFMRKIVYGMGALYGLSLWAIPEGFGGPYGPGSTDIGTAIIYVFVFVALMVIASSQGPDKNSLDHWLEKHLGWWAKLAEFGWAPVSAPVAEPKVGP